MCLQNTNTGTLKPEDHLVLFLHLLLLLLLLKKKKMMIFQLQGKPSSERILLYKPISSSCSKRFHLDRRTRDAQSILQKSFFLWHSESPKGTFEKWVDKEWSRARSNDISVSTHWKVGLICEHIACSDRKKLETSNFSDERKAPTLLCLYCRTQYSMILQDGSKYSKIAGNMGNSAGSKWVHNIHRRKQSIKVIVHSYPIL